LGVNVAAKVAHIMRAAQNDVPLGMGCCHAGDLALRGVVFKAARDLSWFVPQA